jgi:AraC-like DNA-binding protein
MRATAHIEVVPLPAPAGGVLVRARRILRSVSRHAHNSFCFGAVQAGERTVMAGGQAFRAGPGTVLTINPGMVHGCGVSSAPCSYVMFCVRPQMLGFDLPWFPTPVVAHAALAASIIECARSIQGDSTPLTEAAFHTVLGRLCNLADWPAPPPGQSNAMVESVRLRLETAERPVQLAELARQVDCPPHRLCRLFSRWVGMPPYEYHNFVRIRRVRRMLADGLGLAAAAFEAGFSDQSHMHRVFVRLMGMTPGQYLRGLIKPPEGRKPGKNAIPCKPDIPRPYRSHRTR